MSRTQRGSAMAIKCASECLQSITALVKAEAVQAISRRKNPWMHLSCCHAFSKPPPALICADATWLTIWHILCYKTQNLTYLTHLSMHSMHSMHIMHTRFHFSQIERQTGNKYLKTLFCSVVPECECGEDKACACTAHTSMMRIAQCCELYTTLCGLVHVLCCACACLTTCVKIHSTLYLLDSNSGVWRKMRYGGLARRCRCNHALV